MNKMKPNIKIIRIYLELLKNVLKKLFSKVILTFENSIKKSLKNGNWQLHWQGKCNNQNFANIVIVHNILLQTEHKLFNYHQWKYIYICTPFHKPLTKDDIASKIPELVINNKLIEKKTFTKF